jgi:hypothetical protein
LMKTPLSRSGTTETLHENEDCRAGCRPESPRVRENQKRGSPALLMIEHRRDFLHKR